MTDLDDALRRVKFIVSDVDGVLTDGKIWFDGEGRPFRSIHARDGTGLVLWRLAGGMSALISGLKSNAIEAAARQWKCTECHLGIIDKVRVCREMAERHDVSLDEMAFMGDDLIDVNAMQAVGLAVTVSDGIAEAGAVAQLVTDARGGRGALRELVQRILAAQGRLDEVMQLYRNRAEGSQ